MPWSLLADIAFLVHLTFVVFVVAGGALAFRWPRLAWVHIPAFAWSAWVNWAGWYCPLTPLEIWLRRQAGEGFYTGGFIEHYLVPLVYPPGLERGEIILLVTGILAWNVLIYLGVLAYWRRRRQAPAGSVRAGH